jgi:hypothetical protein
MRRPHLQHFVEEFPGVIKGQMITGIVEECLKGKIGVFGQGGFDDEFLIGTMQIDERSNSRGEGARSQRADGVAAEVSVRFDNGMERHIRDLPDVFHVDIGNQITEPEQSFESKALIMPTPSSPDGSNTSGVTPFIRSRVFCGAVVQRSMR